MPDPSAPQPFDAKELPLTTRWPTIGAHPLGRLVGRLSGSKIGVGGFFVIGKLWALATIPLSLAVFAWQLMPFICRRYLLTNRRIVIQKGLAAVEDKAIGLDQFDAIAVEVLPGQAWLHAGDLVFTRNGSEVFRLAGVSRPEVFRHACWSARSALVDIGRVMREQAATPAAPPASQAQ
jgi:hypothetical protein